MCWTSFSRDCAAMENCYFCFKFSTVVPRFYLELMNWAMRLALLFILLLPVCLATPFHQKGLFDFMMEDEGSADMAPTDDPVISGFGPVCPFRCQCHLRVVQCSDLGKPRSVFIGTGLRGWTVVNTKYFLYFMYILCMYISFALWRTTDLSCPENRFSRLFLQMCIK